MTRYKVMVDDNFHYMDEDERYEHGVFLTPHEAIAACKRIVDGNLGNYVKPNMTATELYDLYVTFGDDPFIVRVNPTDEDVNFSAWDYAKERSEVLTSNGRT